MVDVQDKKDKKEVTKKKGNDITTRLKVQERWKLELNQYGSI